MAKRKSNEEEPQPKNRRRKPQPKRHGLGTILLFWPFLLFQKATSGVSQPARFFLRLVGHPAVLALYFLIPMSVFYYGRARGYDMAKVAEMPERTVIYDRHGEEIGRIHGEKRDIIGYSDISLDFIYAIVAREDERFFTHHGVDWIGFGRATLRNVKDRKFKEGASTLTMQLARNTYPLHASWLSFSDIVQELDRKFLEIAVTYRIEGNYSKEEIMQHYVNRIFWGHTIRGIEEAARTYFEKSAKELDLSEAAMLAGIVRGPNAFSPFRDISDAIRERDTTLDRMVIANFITAEQAEAAKAEKIEIRPEWRRVFHDSWAMDAVRRELERILEDEEIEFGGLEVVTTLDLAIQNKAEQALDQHLRKFERSSGWNHQTRSKWQSLPEPRPAPEYLQGSLVVIENATGSIIATVGGRDADESKFNRATQARRQIGSTFKPFVYASAFEAGLRPDGMLSDDPLAPGEVKGAGRWSPKNSDGTYTGYQSVPTGLIRSRNTMAVRAGNFAGISHVADVARQVGFTQPMPRFPTAFLGTIDASPEEVASAFTVFPNGGKRLPPRLIAEIRNRDGEIEYQNPGISYQAIKPEAARDIATILGEVMKRGTGASVHSLGFNKPCGGKTGTTNDYKDAWFTGFTSSLTCSVWVGFDHTKTIMNRAYGSTMALPVWAEVMKSAERLGYPADGLRSKPYFTEARLCRTTHKLATAGCQRAGTAYTDNIPTSKAPGQSDICMEHFDVEAEINASPPKATPVDGSPGTVEEAPTPRAVPVQETSVPRAVPVEEVPRAIPVE